MGGGMVMTLPFPAHFPFRCPFLSVTTTACLLPALIFVCATGAKQPFACRLTFAISMV